MALGQSMAICRAHVACATPHAAHYLPEVMMGPLPRRKSAVLGRAARLRGCLEVGTAVHGWVLAEMVGRALGGLLDR